MTDQTEVSVLAVRLQALERAFNSLERMQERIAALEKADAHNKRTNKYVDSMIWAAAAAAVMFVAAKVGLI